MLPPPPPPYKRSVRLIRYSRFRSKCFLLSLFFTLVFTALALSYWFYIYRQRGSLSKLEFHRQASLASFPSSLATIVPTPTPSPTLTSIITTTSTTTTPASTTTTTTSIITTKRTPTPTSTIITTPASTTTTHSTTFSTFSTTTASSTFSTTSTSASTFTTPLSITKPTAVVAVLDAIDNASPTLLPNASAGASGLAAAAAVAAAGLGTITYGIYNIHFRNKINLEKLRTNSIRDKLHYQQTQEIRERGIWYAEISRLDQDLDQQKLTRDRISDEIADAHRELMTMQTDMQALRVAYQNVLDQSHHLDTAIARISTSIAGLEPRARQDQEKLRVSCRILAETRDRRDLKVADRCDMDLRRSREMKKSILLVLLWHQNALKLKVPGKWKTLVKDFTINLCISSAIDYFNLGGYIVGKFKWAKKDWNWNWNWNSYQYPIGQSTLPPGKPVEVARRLVTVGKKTFTEVVSKTSIVTETVVKRDSILHPLLNYGKYFLGGTLTTQQKVDISYVKRNILLKELQSGWEKEEVIAFSSRIDQQDVAGWAARTGNTELYEECMLLIENEMK